MRASRWMGVFSLVLSTGIGGWAEDQEALPAAPAAPAVQPAPAPAIKPFVSRMGKFTIAASGTPKEVKQTVKTAAGPVLMRMYEFRSGGSVKLACWADYPAAAVRQLSKTAVLDGARNGFVRNSMGTLTNERDIAYLGHPGRELRMESLGKIVFLVRMYLVGNRFYQAVVVSEKDKFDEPAARRFVGSFALLK